VILQLVGRRVRDDERVLVGPDPLPLRLDRLWVVRLHHRSEFAFEDKKASRTRGRGKTTRPRRGRFLRYARSCFIRRNRNRQTCPMLDLFPVSAAIEHGELTLGGLTASELASAHGTPLVVYCEETLRTRARALRAAVGDGVVAYGTKAFANVAVLRLLREEGLRADVATSGELAFARIAGFGGGELIAHGNNKDERFLREAAAEDAVVALDAPDEA